MDPLKELRLGGLLAPTVAQDRPLQPVEWEAVLGAGFLAGGSRKLGALMKSGSGGKKGRCACAAREDVELVVKEWG